MFTTLSVCPPARKFLFRRKIVSQQIAFEGEVFYHSRIISKRSDNSRMAERFKRECLYPVIQSDSSIVSELKYNIMLSSIFAAKQHIEKAFLFDENGQLCFLLPRLLSRVRSVYVYSRREKYYELNEQIFSSIGAAAILTDNPSPPKNTDFVISPTRPPFFCGIPVFGEENWFISERIQYPCPFPQNLPPDANELCVAAGLWRYMGKSRIIFGCCDTVQHKNIRVDLKSLLS